MVRSPGIRDAAMTSSLLAALALGGCGSRAPQDLPPPARAAASPPLTATPVGRVVEGSQRTAFSGEDDPAATHRSRFRDASLTASVLGRARTLEITAGSSTRVVSEEPAGVGPTNVACAPQGPCFVVDTQGDALLVFRVGPGGHDLQLTRRVYLGGAPYGIALDAKRRRLWITLTARNEVVELGAHGRPHVLSRRPTVRQPDFVFVDEKSGDVTIDGRSQRQVITDPASPDR